MTSTTLARNKFVVVTERDAHRNGAAVERVVRRAALPDAGGRRAAGRRRRHALAVFCFDAPDGFVGG